MNKMGKKASHDHDGRTLKKKNAIGKKTIRARKYCARLKTTVANGKTSRGSATFLIKPPLSRMDPGDITRDCAKKFHGRIPTIMKEGNLSTPARSTCPKTKLYTRMSISGLASDQINPKTESRYLS